MHHTPPYYNFHAVDNTEWKVKGLMSNIYRRIHPLRTSPKLVNNIKRDAIIEATLYKAPLPDTLILRPFLDSKTSRDEPLFSDDVAMKIGGDACKRLAAFCRSISDFVYAVRDVIPKQQNVEYMSKQFAEAMKKLEIQQKRKADVLAEKKKLEDSLAEVRQKKDAQQEILNKMAKKVNGARQLIESLKGEKKRWTEDSNRFDQEKRQLLGDSAIAAAFIAYAGPFNYTFRTNILEKGNSRDLMESYVAFRGQEPSIEPLLKNRGLK